MTALTNDQIDKMTKAEVRAACKARGIKHGKMSLMQQRDALKANKDEPAPKTKAAHKKADGPRAGSKMALAVEVFKANKDKERKDIIKLFIDKVKLTKAGASTYYQLVQKKAK